MEYLVTTFMVTMDLHTDFLHSYTHQLTHKRLYQQVLFLDNYYLHSTQLIAENKLETVHNFYILFWGLGAEQKGHARVRTRAHAKFSG